MATEGGHIDLMFLAPPLTRLLDPLLFTFMEHDLNMLSNFTYDLWQVGLDCDAHSLLFYPEASITTEL